MSLFEELERYHLASDDYEELAEALWRASPEKSLEGDPYQPYRARYRRKTAAFPSSGTGGIGPGISGDSGMRHEDLEAPPGPYPQVDFIPYDPGVRCSFCNIRPAECTVNGAALCLQDAENCWGIPIAQAIESTGSEDYFSSAQPAEGEPNDQATEGSPEEQLMRNGGLVLAYDEEAHPPNPNFQQPYEGQIGKYLYHHSPSENRERIQAEGLQPHDPLEGSAKDVETRETAPEGVYLGPYDHVGTHARPGHDVWAVDTNQVRVHRDPSDHDNYWGFYYSEHPIPPHAMKLIHAGMAQYQGGHTFEFKKATPNEMNGEWNHMLIAHPEDDPTAVSGHMQWYHRTGELSMIDVSPAYQRQGLATELWRRAREIAAGTRGVRPPRHSSDRTNAGEAWARSLNERLPRRNESEEIDLPAHESAWRDVMDKAKRLREENAVHLLEVPTPDSPYVFAEVKGDNGTHHCFVAIKGEEQGQWSCSCPWGDFGPNGPLAGDRSPGSPYKKTPCSHILATRWELQSRSMFGRNPYTGALHTAEHETWDDTQYIPGAFMYTHRLDDDEQGRPRYYLRNFIRNKEAPKGTGAELLRKVTSMADRDGVVLMTNTIKGKADAKLGPYYQSFGFERHPQIDGREDSPMGPGYRREPQMTKEGALHLAMNGEDEVPPPLGESPIPQGTLRFFHNTSVENVPSIREHGLLQSYGRGDSQKGFGNEPSAGIWASTKNPAGDPEKKGPDPESKGATIEFWAHPFEVGHNGPNQGEDPEEWAENYSHHVIMNTDIRPRRIVAIHEPWHTAYHHLRDESRDRPNRVKAGEFDGLMDDPRWGETYGRAIRKIKREGSLDVLDEWFAGRFLEAARTTVYDHPHDPGDYSHLEGWLAPHRFPEGSEWSTKEESGSYGRNPRAMQFDHLDDDTQKNVKTKVHQAIAEAEPIANTAPDSHNPIPPIAYKGPKTQRGIVGNITKMFHDARRADEKEGTNFVSKGLRWYHDAHDKLKGWSNNYGIDHYHMTAATAALSPSTDWDTNLSMAHYHASKLGTRNADGSENNQVFKVNKDHPTYAKHKQDAFEDDEDEGIEGGYRKKGVDLDSLDGKRFRDMSPKEAYHALKHSAKTEEIYNRDWAGTDAEHPDWHPGWQSSKNGMRSIRMMRGEDPDQLLVGHKIRSFHNNLYHPGHTDDVTVDSHATSLAIGAKMGANSSALGKVLEFGDTKRERVHNSQGGHSYFADAYRKAHAQLVKDGHMSADTTPADLQAIVWGRWRHLMPTRQDGKKAHVSTRYSPKNKFSVLGHLAAMDADEEHYDDDEHFLDPFGGPEELDPDLHAWEDPTFEEPEAPDEEDQGYDELPADDDYSDLLYERRKEGAAMYDWAQQLRQERRQALAAQVVPPPRAVPVEFLPTIPHHLSSGMDEFGFEPHRAIAQPSEGWQEDHSPGANNPASTAPPGFGDNLDPNWTPGKDIGNGSYPDERLLEPGPVLTSPIRSPGFNSGYEVMFGHKVQAQGGGGGSSYVATQPVNVYTQAPMNAEPPFPMVQAPSSQPISTYEALGTQEAPGASQATASLQEGLEWLRPPGGAPDAFPGASPGISREAASQDNLNLAAAADAFLKTGSVPVPGFEVNMDTILSMPKGFMSGMPHDARSRDFTPDEQDEMVREGEGTRASNLHMLRLEGSMYEELERQTATDDQAQDSATAFWW